MPIFDRVIRQGKTGAGAEYAVVHDYDGDRDVTVWAETSRRRAIEHVLEVGKQGPDNVRPLPGEITRGKDREYNGKTYETWLWSLPEDVKAARKSYGPRDSSSEVALASYNIALGLAGVHTFDDMRIHRKHVMAAAKEIAIDLSELIGHIRRLANQ